MLHKILRDISRHFVLTVVCLLLLPDLPRVLNMPHTLYLPRGMEGHIECPVEANPPVTQVVWTQNEKRLNDSKRLKVGRGGTLLIKSVTSSDEGRYTCTPYSPRGAGRSSSVVQIFVKGKWSFCTFYCRCPFYVHYCILLYFSAIIVLNNLTNFSLSKNICAFMGYWILFPKKNWRL